MVKTQQLYIKESKKWKSKGLKLNKKTKSDDVKYQS